MSSERELAHDRVWEAYYGNLGPNWMRETQKRIHWVCAMAPGRNVLDVGCSSGVVPILLGREGRTVVGIDSDPKSIAEANVHLEDEPPSVQKRIKFIEGDFLAYDGFEREQFDTIVMSEVLEHLVRPADFVKAAWQYMSDGAKIVVTVPFGINDFVDHKRTFYLTEIYELLSQCFVIDEIKYLGQWIGLVGKKSSRELPMQSGKSWETADVAALERAFFDVERALRDDLAAARGKSTKLSECERALRGELKAERSRNAILVRKERAQREAAEKSLETLAEERAARQALQNKMSAQNKELETKAAAAELIQEEVERLRQQLERVTDDSGRALDEVNSGLQKSANKVAALKRQLQLAKEREEQAIQQANEIRGTISFQLGQALILATRSWGDFVRLPVRIVRLRRKGTARRNSNKGKPESFPTVLPLLKPTEQQIIHEMQVDFRKQSGQLRVAAVMDEFTQHSFDPECELLQLRPDLWSQQLAEFDPDLVFIESAWKGVEDLWQRKISNVSSELLDIIKWSRARRIPSVFWNKEDPVHFSTFLPVAKMADYVFTTDVDCIPKYKHHLGHDRVFVMPFAAQPKTHNPIELYERKDAFCFAGSYYLRYPERQRDFATLVDTARAIKRVEIYDRNYGKAHSHYAFPERYASLILGRLPFNEIDRAYKGYTFGINVNTIKQSQTMFARRAFELLASNTVVVSNFSRAMRLLFGDIVVSSDSGTELARRLEQICGDERIYRKLRLAGLRKVMMEHTYAQRLAYICSKLRGEVFELKAPAVAVIAVARTPEERERLVRQFRRQTYPNKQLYLYQMDRWLGDATKDEYPSYTDIEACRTALLDCFHATPLVALFVPSDHYGPEYLTDLAVASTYAEAPAFGKGTYYVAEGNRCVLWNDGAQYKHTDVLPARRGMSRTDKLDSRLLDEWIADPSAALLPNGQVLAIDEFHYCQDGASLDDETLSENLEDGELARRGIPVASLLEVAERLDASAGHEPDGRGPHLTAEQLYQVLPQPQSSQLTLEYIGNNLRLTSRLSETRHTYIYTSKRFSREELNLVSNSNFKLDCTTSVDLHTVFEFYDSDGLKLSHSINKVGGTNALAIPEKCDTVRFGIRLKGRGRADIRCLRLGENGERPASILGQSRFLVLTKQYPAYDDLYRYGFLHSRVRAYKRHGLAVDVFRITREPGHYYREFEGIDVASGDAELLDVALSSGQYEHVLVHLLDEKMWQIIDRHLDKLQVTVWAHGAELQVWQRRAFEFERLPGEEIERQKRLSDKRARFWNALFSASHDNVHFVFVSEWLRRSALSDLDVSLPSLRSSVVHNYIDSDIFRYQEKQGADRLRILVVRPFNKLTYGNDLAVRAIKELSRLDFFKELNFTIVGDGELFDQTVLPLRAHPNVSIEKRFLSHSELVAYHERHGVFLAPTRMDTQGVSRDEAMASGLVPVTNDVGAVSEFVDASCGMLVPAEDARALAAAIEYLYNNPETFLRLSEAAAKRVRAQSGFEQTIGREMAMITG